MIKVLPKKAVVNMTPIQYKKIDDAAKKIGLSVPKYLLSKGLVAADKG